jgi:hypothetical protein
VVFGLAVSCGDNSSPSVLKEPIDWTNSPEHIPGADAALVLDPDGLPDSGAAAKPVWTTYWYPISEYGTARRPWEGELSPMEKYDTAMGDSSMRATGWEMAQYTYYGNVPWAGHCNGVAAAGTMVDEPRKEVWYNGVRFSVDDVKALMVESFQGGGVVIGGRCNLSALTLDREGRPTDPECRDTNPGSFHIAVTNYLGRFKKPIIADSDPVYPVWNYAITSYRVREKRKLSSSEVAQWMGISNYRFNPRATSFAYYQTEVVYSGGFTKIYEYFLELSGSVIIGGEWYRNSRTDHPDFLWRHTVPTAENPYLNLDVVRSIYEKSV